MFDLKKLYLINKEKLAVFLFFSGMLIAYLGSLNPWFMWPIGTLYAFPAGILLVASYLLSITLSRPIYTRNDFILPLTAFIALSYYQLFVNGGRIGGFIFNLFHVVIFLCLFLIDIDKLEKLATFLCKFMGGLLAVSTIAYILWIFGFPFPSRDASFSDGLYSFTNYFFFLIDDRALLALFYRFHSVFLEPGQIGTACVMLLFTQCGKWRKWYNIAMIITAILSFSLAAYVLIVYVTFANLWIQGKKVFLKMAASVFIFVTIIVGSFFYNNGNNLIHDLILIRMEVDDGDIVGNNRVTEDFDAEYSNFWKSSDIILGRDMPKDNFGNSGYKVYIYENGVIGMILLVFFFFSSLHSATNKKALLSGVLLALLAFIVRGTPLWYCNFIPIYVMAFYNPRGSHTEAEANNRKEQHA